MSVVERERVVPPVVPVVLDPRVVRGTELLDERMPGWAERIDLETLRLSSPCKCICGQIGGGYAKGMERLGHPDNGDGRSFGFFCDDFSEYSALEQDWRLAILSRRTPA